MEPDTHQKYTPQKISYFSDALVVHLVDFPIYYLECISERHFIIAGGGGSSKTGVHNQINILELIPTGDSCAADLIMKYHTPKEIPDAIMTGSLMKDLPIISTRLVTGGPHATIYHISFDSHKKSFAITDNEVLKDKQAKAELKSVKYTPGKILTGALDGQLTVWDVGAKRIDHQIKAHTKEIDEIDVDLVNQQIVTLSRDEGRCAVWSLSSLKLVREFKKDFINSSNGNGVKYVYRSCRFAFDSTLETTKKGSPQSFLLVACNPVPKGQSKLYKWKSDNFKEFTSIPATVDGVMAMTVSLDGKFVAVGTRSGSVSVFEVKNLKQIYKIDGAHYNAVTNLEFLAPKPESLSLTNSQTCPLLSVSIDRRIVLHRPKRWSIVSSICKVLLMVFIMYITFVFLVKLNAV